MKTYKNLDLETLIEQHLPIEIHYKNCIEGINTSYLEIYLTEIENENKRNWVIRYKPFGFFEIDKSLKQAIIKMIIFLNKTDKQNIKCFKYVKDFDNDNIKR